MSLKFRHTPWLAALLMSALASPAFAASNCLGTTQDRLAPAMNAAIFLLLGIVGVILPAFGYFIYYLARRARMPLPPHAEFVNPDNDPS
ncbi:MAG: hypothetical protein QM796_09375 [Chthoniobacteraceae bacterium]